MLQKNERLLLFVLAAIQFTNIVDFMIMMPMGDVLKKDLHISPGQYGWLVSSYGLAAFATALLGVFYLDNIDRKKALLTAYLGFMVGTVSSALVPTTENLELNYYLFIGTRVVTGITGGLLGGLVMAIVGDTIPLERRGRAMAVITLAFSLASILGVPIALIGVDAFDNNWHVPFYLVSGMSFIIWIFAFRAIPSMTAHLTSRTEVYKRSETFIHALKTPQQRSALLFTITLVLGQFTVISFMTPYYINNVGLVQSEIKYIYMIGGVSTVLSSYFIGKWVDKFGRFRMFTIFALLAMIPLLAITHLPAVPLYVVLCIAACFFTIVAGRMIPANTIITAVVDPKHRAGFMSLNSAAQSLASGSSAAIAGMIIYQANDHAPLENYEYVGYLAVASNVVALLLVRSLKGMAKKGGE